MRVRITFSKIGALRYIGHLDLHQVWERTIRRAGLPLAYTQGFHPGPKMQIAAALPLGFSGEAELIDIWLKDGTVETGELRERLQKAAPPGLKMVSVEPVDEHAPVLQTQVVAAEYEVTILEGDPADAVRTVLMADSLPRERRGKAYDLRPLILALEPMAGGLCMRLMASAGATGRPEEVLAELGIPLESARITRKRLIFKDDVK